MKGDFTRITFEPQRHYAGVLMQQGRVQLDADWNEQAAIMLHQIRTPLADMIGPYGGPVNNLGFKLVSFAGNNKDISIQPGRYYVDGILCELDPQVIMVGSRTEGSPKLTLPTLTLDGRQLAKNDWVEIRGKTGAPLITQVNEVDVDNHTLSLTTAIPAGTPPPFRVRRAVTLLTQPDLPGGLAPDKSTTVMAYLDVWERHITAVQDAHIREVALGGPNTASRSQVVCQIKTEARIPDDSARNANDIPSQWQAWVNLWQGEQNGRLAAQLEIDTVSTDPCTIAPDSAYRGQENQLYRVEIHRGGTAKTDNNEQTDFATFKWSRDNGSIMTALLENHGDELVVENSRDMARNGWVEITDDTRELQGKPGVLVRLSNVENDVLTLDTSTTGGVPDISSMRNPQVRRWDQQENEEVGLDPTDHAIPLTEGEWLDLEDGIRVYFEPAPDGQPHQYRTGDYWLIPARTNGTIEWAYERDAMGKPRLDAKNRVIPIALPPYGITHHYAPIAILGVGAGGEITLQQDLTYCFDFIAGPCANRD